jgi:predicted extracellular nuclease
VTALVASPEAYNGFFLIDPAACARTNMEHCGLWVYTSNQVDAGVSQGDEVTVVGSVLEYDVREAADTFRGDGTTTEIDMSGGSVTVLSSGNALPTPKDASPSDLADDSVAEAHEGSLMMVSNLTYVESLCNGEWKGQDSSGVTILIDDAFISREDLGVDGTEAMFTVTGILHYSYGDFKLEPRDATDVIRAVY